MLEKSEYSVKTFILLVLILYILYLTKYITTYLKKFNSKIFIKTKFIALVQYSSCPLCVQNTLKFLLKT